MGLRLPKASQAFQKFGVNQIVNYAQGIHDGLLASIADFPTPPVLPVALQTFIDNYVTALTNAAGGGKALKALQHDALFQLLNALRQDALYVNQIITIMITGGTSYTDAQALIGNTGYMVSLNPSPAGPLPSPVIKKYGSYKKGQFNLQLIRVPGARGYLIKLGDQTTLEQTYLTFSNTRITIPNLISTHVYVASIASIGANATRNFDVQVSQVIT